jgi:hypothetical protein
MPHHFSGVFIPVFVLVASICGVIKMTNPHIRQCPECGENCLQCVGTYSEWWEDNHLRLAQDEPKITIEEREEKNDS